jgi:hypothetical protein
MNNSTQTEYEIHLLKFRNNKRELKRSVGEKDGQSIATYTFNDEVIAKVSMNLETREKTYQIKE